jgi:hypothetical protein
LPSLDQLHFEAFARVVERAVAPAAAGWGAEPLPVRVLTKDGRELAFHLTEVDLYDRQLVGSGAHGAPMRLPLADVRAVFGRRPHVPRLLLIWLSLTAAGAFGGLLLTSRQHWLTPALDTFVGACCGAAIAGAVSWLLRDWSAMYRWVSMYGSPAA